MGYTVDDKSVKDLRVLLEKAQAEYQEASDRYDDYIATLEKKTESGDTPMLKDEKDKLLIGQAKVTHLERKQKKLADDLAVAESVREAGHSKSNTIVADALQLDQEHMDASEKLYEKFCLTATETTPGKVDFGVLSEEERAKFVTEDGFRVRPTLEWRSDSGDGADVVQTTIARTAVERLKFYGPCEYLFQKFRWDTPGDFKVALGDQTGLMATESGTGGNAQDESFANFANAELTYNLSGSALFRPRNLIAFTRWTTLSNMRTALPGRGGHMRILESGMARKVNNLLTTSTANGASETRTNAVGLKSAVPYELLSSNNLFGVADILKLPKHVNRAYRTGSEDDVMRIDPEVYRNQVGMNQGMPPSSLGWMTSDSLYWHIVELAAVQAENNKLPWYMQFDSMDDDPNTRLRLFGSPVYVNDDLGGLESTPGTGTNLLNMILIYGRFGYMAMANLDMFIREYGPESGAATWGTYKFNHVGVTCKTWDSNALAVGAVSGQTEALYALGTKQA